MSTGSQLSHLITSSSILCILYIHYVLLQHNINTYGITISHSMNTYIVYPNEFCADSDRM